MSFYLRADQTEEMKQATFPEAELSLASRLCLWGTTVFAFCEMTDLGTAFSVLCWGAGAGAYIL